jgi:hypothetical protein
VQEICPFENLLPFIGVCKTVLEAPFSLNGMYHSLRADEQSEYLPIYTTVGFAFSAGNEACAERVFGQAVGTNTGND